MTAFRVNRSNTNYWEDTPSSHRDTNSCVAFAGGHVETYVWADSSIRDRLVTRKVYAPGHRCRRKRLVSMAGADHRRDEAIFFVARGQTTAAAMGFGKWYPPNVERLPDSFKNPASAPQETARDEQPTKIC